jgi:hypothetical protein
LLQHELLPSCGPSRFIEMLNTQILHLEVLPFEEGKSLAILQPSLSRSA